MDQRAKRNSECAGYSRGPFIRHFRCDIKPIANVCVTWRVRRRDSWRRNLSIVRGIISAAAAELWNYRPRGRLRALSRLANFARPFARCAQCDKSRQNRFLRFWSWLVKKREKESWLSAENFSLQFCKKNGANLAASLIIPREQAIVLHCCTIFFSFFAVVYLFSEIHS